MECLKIQKLEYLEKHNFFEINKIFNLCLTWHIFRSYCFVVEITFNEGWNFTLIHTGLPLCFLRFSVWITAMLVFSKHCLLKAVHYKLDNSKLLNTFVWLSNCVLSRLLLVTSWLILYPLFRVLMTCFALSELSAHCSCPGFAMSLITRHGHHQYCSCASVMFFRWILAVCVTFIHPSSS